MIWFYRICTVTVLQVQTESWCLNVSDWLGSEDGCSCDDQGANFSLNSCCRNHWNSWKVVSTTSWSHILLCDTPDSSARLPAATFLFVEFCWCSSIRLMKTTFCSNPDGKALTRLIVCFLMRLLQVSNAGRGTAVTSRKTSQKFLQEYCKSSNYAVRSNLEWTFCRLRQMISSKSWRRGWLA